MGNDLTMLISKLEESDWLEGLELITEEEIVDFLTVKGHKRSSFFIKAYTKGYIEGCAFGNKTTVKILLAYLRTRQRVG